MMSGHRYAQATSEESTEMVTNRAGVNPLYWNSATASYVEPSTQTAANLASNFSNLRISPHSGDVSSAPVLSRHPQLTSSTAFPNMQSEMRRSQNTEVSETQPSNQHLR